MMAKFMAERVILRWYRNIQINSTPTLGALLNNSVWGGGEGDNINNLNISVKNTSSPYYSVIICYRIMDIHISLLFIVK